MAPGIRAAREVGGILIRKIRSSGKSRVFAYLQAVGVMELATGHPSGPHLLLLRKAARLLLVKLFHLR
jgi:hypothetical protein